MPLEPGEQAPPVALPTARGPLSIDDLLETSAARGVLIAFFKTTCPTCAMTMPLVATLGHHLHDDMPIVAIAEDALAPATAWLHDLGFRGEVASDAYASYATARRFGVRVLPTVVLLAGDRSVKATLEGWDRSKFNQLANRAAELAARPEPPLSTHDDGRPDRQAGCWPRRVEADVSHRPGRWRGSGTSVNRRAWAGVP